MDTTTLVPAPATTTGVGEICSKQCWDLCAATLKVTTLTPDEYAASCTCSIVQQACVLVVDRGEPESDTSGLVVVLICFCVFFYFFGVGMGFMVGLYRGDWILQRWFGYERTRTGQFGDVVMAAGAGGAPEMKSVRDAKLSARVVDAIEESNDGADDASNGGGAGRAFDDARRVELVDRVRWKLAQPHAEPELWFERTRPDALSSWNEMMAKIGKLVRGSPQLIEATRRGVPAEMRYRLWPALLGVNAEAKMLVIYQRCTESDFIDSATQKQIEADLHRTFPDRPAFARNGVGIPRLRRVLHAYSTFDFDVGYVQGMNFIAATLLAYMNSFATFWALVAIMYRFRRRDSFLSEFRGIVRDVWVFRQLLKQRCPRLVKHFAQRGIRLAPLLTPTYLTLFAGVLPFDVTARIWDLLFASDDPPSVLHSVALAMLAHLEDALLAESTFDRCMAIFGELGDFFPRAEPLIASALSNPVKSSKLVKLHSEFRGAKIKTLDDIDPAPKASQE